MRRPDLVEPALKRPVEPDSRVEVEVERFIGVRETRLREVVDDAEVYPFETVFQLIFERLYHHLIVDRIIVGVSAV